MAEYTTRFILLPTELKRELLLYLDFEYIMLTTLLPEFKSFQEDASLLRLKFPVSSDLSKREYEDSEIICIAQVCIKAEGFAQKYSSDNPGIKNVVKILLLATAMAASMYSLK